MHRQLALESNQWNHDLGNHLDALLGHLYRGFKDRACLHLGDVGMHDAEPAAAEAQHRIELVQVLHPLEQHGQLLLQLAHRNAVILRHSLLLFAAGVRKQRHVHHQVLALRQKLVQRRIQRADDHRVSIHGFEQPGKILALHGEQLLQRLVARLLVLGQNHGLHEWDAIGREEHVLSPAQANAFGSELARSFRIAGNVRVGANAEFTAKHVGPLHEFDEQRRLWIRLLRLRLAQVDVRRGAVERDPVALFDDDVLSPNLHRELLLVFFNVQRSSAHYAGQSHAARHHRRMARLSAHRRKHPGRYFHAVNIVGRGLFADQNHRALGREHYRFIGVKHGASHRRSRRRIDSVCDLSQGLERRLIKQRMQ